MISKFLILISFLVIGLQSHAINPDPNGKTFKDLCKEINQNGEDITHSSTATNNSKSISLKRVGHTDVKGRSTFSTTLNNNCELQVKMKSDKKNLFIDPGATFWPQQRSCRGESPLIPFAGMFFENFYITRVNPQSNGFYDHLHDIEAEVRCSDKEKIANAESLLGQLGVSVKFNIPRSEEHVDVPPSAQPPTNRGVSSVNEDKK